MMSSVQSSTESRSPKIKRNFSSSVGLHNRLSRANNNSMSSLHSGLNTHELGAGGGSGSMSRTFNSVKSMPSLKKQPVKTVKRLGTPIKVKRGSVKASTIIDDEEDDEMIQSLTREIEELRAKRLSHDFYKRAEDDDDDDFETAIFAETLLGELGSSSGSHKDDLEDENDVLAGDSGASDRQLTPVKQVSS